MRRRFFRYSRLAADLVGRYPGASVRLLISSAFRNDTKTHELVASDIIPHFA